MTRTVMLAAIAPGLFISGAAQSAGIGTSYSATFTVIGGGAPYRLSESGSLPSGLSFTDNGNGTCTISGTPTAAGNFPITLTAIDGQRRTAALSFTLISAALPLAITNSFASYTAGIVQSFDYTTSGGQAGAKTFSLTSGALPPGLTLSSAGHIGGNTTGLSVGAHMYTFGVTAMDSASATSPELAQTVTVTVASLSITNSAPAGTQGTSYSFSYTKSGGTGAIVWSVQSGTLPSGLSLSSGGVLSGTPTSNGTYSFVVAATDNAGTVATRSQSVSIAYPILTLTGTYTGSVQIQTAYSSDLSISGGNGVYSNARVTAGALPTGLSLSIVNVSGAYKLRLSGTPTTVASSSFTVAVDSGDGQTATSSQTVAVTADPTALSIYNKLYNGTAFTGDYWDMTEASGTRASASGNFNLTVGGTTHADNTETGPRGGADKAWSTAGTASFLSHSRTAGDALDTATNFGFYVFVKFHATTASVGVGGTYVGGSQPQGGIFFWTKTTGGISAYAGNTATGTWTTADGSIPDTTNWHLLAGWRDSTDGKLRLAIDGGTPIASSASFTANSTSYDIEFGSTGSFYCNCGIGPSAYVKGGFFTQAEQIWLFNSGSARHWAEIKNLAGH